MKVELLDVFGNDLMIANAARVSYGKSKNFFDEKDEKLLRFLVKHNHISPFFHPKLQFRITCPIYVERQLKKTTIGVDENSISGRYVDFSDTYTRIENWRKQSTSSKQGSFGSVENQHKCSLIEDNIIEVCKKAYEDLINEGVSKEQARSVLPLSLNTTMIWTGSLQAFLRLCQLRLKEDAQIETGDVVREMLNEVKKSGSFDKTLLIYDL